MAAAEVRAAWQRTANRCFVQEDAKRAPKLACCPSSSASSNQVDQIPTNNFVDKDGYNPSLGFMPFNTNPSLSNLSPESRWWLQSKPTYELPCGLIDDHHRLKISETPVVTDGANYESRKIFGPSSGMEKIQEQLKIDSMEESYEFLEMDIDKSKDNSFNSESMPWSSEKSEPWWRMADGYDLASFVTQRSHDVVENCDLPCPQNTHMKKDPYAYFGSTGSNNNNRVLSPSSSHKLSLSNANIPSREKSEDDRSKAELLDALLHSQTRARVAEKAAQQAYAEKEHILKLFFRQASHLFAYKQWFQLLQLENLYFQIKNHNNQATITTLFPLANIPWMAQKKTVEKEKTHKRRERIREQGVGGCDFGKLAIAFALGFGLVGAGLLLGWSIGWMLPATAAI